MWLGHFNASLHCWFSTCDAISRPTLLFYWFILWIFWFLTTEIHSLQYWLFDQKSLSILLKIFCSPRKSSQVGVAVGMQIMFLIGQFLDSAKTPIQRSLGTDLIIAILVFQVYISKNTTQEFEIKLEHCGCKGKIWQGEINSNS